MKLVYTPPRPRPRAAPAPQPQEPHTHIGEFAPPRAIVVGGPIGDFLGRLVVALAGGRTR